MEKRINSILIVDDSIDHRLDLVITIKEKLPGTIIYEASNQEDAIKIAENLASLSLLICDIYIPQRPMARSMERAGIETMEKIRSIHPSIPIIGYTMCELGEIKPEIEMLNAQYVRKTFYPIQLISRLKEILHL